MTAHFFVKGSTADVSDYENPADETTFVTLKDSDGSALIFIVKPNNAAEALAIGDAFRAAALKHLPVPQEVPA
jgi:hypothetical protein